MITIILILLHTNGQPPLRHELSVYAIPAIGEMVQIGGQLYRVLDVTHYMEEQSIEVRATA